MTVSPGQPRALADPRAVLRRHGLTPRRGLGQHFLVNLGAAGRIADLCVEREGDAVIEVGPGAGTLTSALLARGAIVTAVERDPDMVRLLRAELGERPGLTLVEGDALSFDYASAGRDAVAAGNLPYNVGTLIVLRAVAARAGLRRMVFMLQAEVAERIAAPPGGKTYGALSLLVQALCDARTVFTLSPGSFSPRPKVDSTVIELVPQERPRLGAVPYEAFRAVVNAAFSKRRKTMKNALLGAGTWPLEAVLAALDDTGIDPVRRAETLAVEEFAGLAQRLSDAGDRRVG